MKIIRIDKNKEKNLFIFSGWGFDYKFFSNLKLDYNLISYDVLDLKVYKKIISDFLINYKEDFIFLLGWSMGGIILSNILKEISNDYFYKKIQKIFLIACAEKFNIKELQLMQLALKKDFNLELKQFYRRVFLGDKDKYEFFKNNYWNYYFNNANKELLLEHLNLMLSNKLDINFLKKFRIKIIASEKDIISKFNEVIKLKDRLGVVEIYINKLTHVPFLYQQVIDEINKG